jgi:hypothetical protein
MGIWLAFDARAYCGGFRYMKFGVFVETIQIS